MLLAVGAITGLRWLEYSRGAQSAAPSMSPAAAGRALALAIAIETSTGLHRWVYEAVWSSPSEIRTAIIDRLSRSLSSLELQAASKARLEETRAALMIAAAELGEPSNRAAKQWSPPHRLRQAYPQFWGKGENPLVGESHDLDAWLGAILEYRVLGESGASASSQLERAKQYLNFVTGARLSAWLLAAISLVFLLASSSEAIRVDGSPPSEMIYSGIRGLFFFVVGDEIVQWSASQASGWTEYWLWTFAHALLFAAVITWACHRVGLSRLLAGPRALAVIGWSAVALGLIIAFEEVWSLLVGEASPLLYLRPKAVALGVELLVIATFSIVLTPLLEELIFREMFFSGLRAKLGSALAIGISALGFAAIHVGTVDHVLFALFVGIALAVVRSRSGSLLPCVVCHSVVNMWWWFRDFFFASAG